MRLNQHICRAARKRCAPIAAALALTAALMPAIAAAVPARAGDDFYRFANGAWDDATVLAPDTPNWGVRAQLRQDNLKRMAKLFTAAARGGPSVSASAKRTGDYFAAQLNLAAIEAKGMTPIRPLLERIAAIGDKTMLARYLGESLRIDVDPVNFGAVDSQFLFGLWIGPDMHDPGRYLPYLTQGGIVLPSPDYYLSDTPGQQAVRADYRNYIGAMLAHAGIADGAAKAARIVELEALIAAAHASPKASADLAQAGQVWRRADFQARAAGFDWNSYFAAAGLAQQQDFGVWQPQAIAGIAALVAAKPLDVWKDYLSFQAINAHARFLPKAVADRYFAFFDPLFIGPGQHRPLLDHVLNQTTTDMPDAGRLFAARHFPPLARARAQEMTARIVAAFAARIDTLAWMSESAKKEAKAKLQAMHIGVGHPQSWPDTSALEIKADDPVGNVQRVAAFNYRHALAKLGTPVDRTEWIRGGELFGINPMPLQNAMTIPMTELQKPFFDPDGSDAANYGAMGTRIGRFIALALNEEGSRFDASGELRQWWSADDAAAFGKAAASLVDQYAQYKPFPDLALDGKRTLNNNAADLAGLVAAHDAYRSALAAKGGKVKLRAADRQFFLAYARSLRQKTIAPVLRGQAAGAPLAPATYRVATVRNLDAWRAAFDVVPGDALYVAPDAQVRLW
jgi:putative endopeptidase